MVRTWSLGALDEADGQRAIMQGSSSRTRSSASVGTTPSNEDMDLETFLSERMRQDFQMGSPPR